MIFEYKGKKYPSYLLNGNAIEHIENTAKHFCKGYGLDIGGLKEWAFKGAVPINIESPVLDYDAYNLPEYNNLDYIASSHCLEHLDDPYKALELWTSKIKKGGVLFIYLPHPDQEYWAKDCPKHKHCLFPYVIKEWMAKLGYKDILQSERDMYWSYTTVGIRGDE